MHVSNTKHFMVTALIGIMFMGQVSADEIAEAGREILAQYKDSVITVQLVVKQTISFPGSPSREMESKLDVTGTVIADTGLTVVSLSEVDPAAMMAAMTDMSDIKMDTDIQEVTMLMSGGDEVSAEVILRDNELDLAFIRPLKKSDTPFSHVSLEDSGAPLQLDPVISVNQLGKVARRAHSISVERIDAIVAKPRTFYLLGSNQTSTSLGCPVFRLDGKVIGVLFMRAIKSTATSSFSGANDTVASIVLPGIDILEAAEQVPPFE